MGFGSSLVDSLFYLVYKTPTTIVRDFEAPCYKYCV